MKMLYQYANLWGEQSYVNVSTMHVEAFVKNINRNFLSFYIQICRSCSGW